jgi:arsenate reductase (glutaredoxin)
MASFRGAKMSGKVTIYHNPKCGSSRTALALIREKGIEPTVIEYLKTPPTAVELKSLIKRMGVAPRALLRTKEAPYAELKLDNPKLADDRIIAAMVAHPILMNRPIVVTANGVRLGRPPESVLEIL